MRLMFDSCSPRLLIKKGTTLFAQSLLLHYYMKVSFKEYILGVTQNRASELGWEIFLLSFAPLET